MDAKQPITGRGKSDVANIINDQIAAFSHKKNTAFWAAIVQLVENAIDAGSTRTDILLERTRLLFSVADDGSGFLEKDRNGLVTIRTSAKAGEKGKIGRNGSGRLACFGLGSPYDAVTIDIFSRPSDLDGQLIWYPYQLADVHASIRAACIGEDYIITWNDALAALPDPLPPIGATGTTVSLRGVDWSKIPSPEDVREHLAAYLRPSYSERCWVNGVQITRRSCRSMVVRNVTYPVLGDVEVELYIPDEVGDNDELVVGGFNPVDAMREFIKALPRKHRERVPNEFRSRDCEFFGCILISAFNNYVVHDRGSFDAAIFQDKPLIDAFFTLLNELAAEMREKSSRHADSQAETATDEVLDAICATLNELTGPLSAKTVRELTRTAQGRTKPPKRVGTLSVSTSLGISPRRVELAIGESYEFEVKNLDLSSGSLTWDDVGSGGTVHPRRGTKTVYTAGPYVGDTFTLTVSDDLKAGLTDSATIRIVTDKAFRIAPTTAQIRRGMRRSFTAKHIDKTSGDLIWDIVPPVPGVSLTSTTGMQVFLETTKEAPIMDDLQLVCWDAQDPAIRAVATVTLHETPELPRNITIEKRCYLLLADRTPGQEIAKGKLADDDSEGIAIDKMFVYPNNPVYKEVRSRRRRDAEMVFIFTHILVAHLRAMQGIGEDLDDLGVMSRRLNDLLASYLMPLLAKVRA